MVCVQALTGQESQGSALSRLCRTVHGLGAAALLPRTVASLALAPAETGRAAAAASATAAPSANDMPVVIQTTATTVALAHMVRARIQVRSDLPPCEVSG